METLFDVWEGSLDIDEEIIKAGGISGLIIRLNHMSGGHHMDTNFAAQWDQATRFLRAPYFVYNPWVGGHENFLWLIHNLPAFGVTRIFIDIEVKYDEYSPEIYADQVQIFTDELKAVYPLVVIYTGQWFLPFLSHWPTNVEYWWARYPLRFYPDAAVNWTYQQLEQETERYGFFPDPQRRCPGIVKLWQCSGDRIKLPGCRDRAIDVNLFNGTPQELRTWWGVPPSEPPELTLEQKVELLWQHAKELDWPLP